MEQFYHVTSPGQILCVTRMLTRIMFCGS